MGNSFYIEEEGCVLGEGQEDAMFPEWPEGLPLDAHMENACIKRIAGWRVFTAPNQPYTEVSNDAPKSPFQITGVEYTIPTTANEVILWVKVL